MLRSDRYSIKPSDAPSTINPEEAKVSLILEEASAQTPKILEGVQPVGTNGVVSKTYDPAVKMVYDSFEIQLSGSSLTTNLLSQISLSVHSRLSMNHNLHQIFFYFPPNQVTHLNRFFRFQFKRK